MPLPSFFQRFFKGAPGQRPGAEAVSLSQADVEAVRVRARRRLIGMAVLVGAGVIGFPWLFETKPRPMSMDIAVVQQGASAPTVGAVTKPGVQAQVKSMSKPQPAADEPREEVVEDTPTAKVAAVKLMDKDASKGADKASSKAVDKPADKGADKAIKAPDKRTDKAADKKSVDTKDAKDSKPAASAPQPAKAVAGADKAASAAPVRYVVQIGAYSDVPSAHEVRMKAERAGLKTYTQVIGVDANKKIRVRLGPFEDKAAADKAMATLRKAGLPGALLTL